VRCDKLDHNQAPTAIIPVTMAIATAIPTFETFRLAARVCGPFVSDGRSDSVEGLLTTGGKICPMKRYPRRGKVSM
jgi:hypothetical protein